MRRKSKSATSHIIVCYGHPSYAIPISQTTPLNPMKKSIERNSLLVKCSFCGSESRECQNIEKEVYESKCSACNEPDSHVNVDCDECGEMVIFRECGEGRCLSFSCKKHFDLEYLKNALVSSQAHGKEGSIENYWGNCSDCGVSEALVRTDNDQWICANCLQVFDPESLSTCGWCNVPCTGDVGEMSSYTGCDFCEGSNQYRKDME